MTPVEIAYFKHFLFDRGIQSVYIHMYKRNRIKGNPDGSSGNPESLEQFLQEQPPHRVLMHAFYFQPNSNYGYDYWNDINKKWMKYLELCIDNPKNEKVIVFKGSFVVLRQNWDKPEYWKTETMEATYKRMHMEPPVKDVDLETAFSVPPSTSAGVNWATNTPQNKFKVGDIIQGTISGEVLTITAVKVDGYETNDGGFIDFDKESYWLKIDEVASGDDEKISDSNTKSQKADAGSLLEGFSLVETFNNLGGSKLETNTVSVNLRNGGYKITFSLKQSDKLRKHGYKYVKLLTKKDTGEIALIFNNQNGCKVTIKKDSDKNRNITINSKEIVNYICQFYDIKDSVDYFKLFITDTIQQDLNIIYKLKYDR